MFRKQIAAILAAVLVLSLGTACAGQNTVPSGAADEAAVVEDAGVEAGEESVSVESTQGTSSLVAEGADVKQDDVAQEAAPSAEGATAQAAQGETTEAGQGVPAAGVTADSAQEAQGTPTPASSAGATTTPAQEAQGVPAAGASAAPEEEAQGAPAQDAQATPTPASVNPAPAMVKGEPESSADVILPGFTYTLRGVKEVDGRQGIACENGEYWVSGSTTLTHYDKGWKAVATNNDPFKDFEVKVNHIGDIDVYNGEIYVGAENFADGVGSDIQIAVYDAQTLQLSRTYMFNEGSGQEECSGIAVDPDTKSIWMCSWVGDESGRYLYRYSLETGEYIGKIHLQAPPQWLQGVAYFNGYLYMTADDGTADMGEPDHIYRWRVDPDSTTAAVTLERTLDDVAVPGEIEGLSFDKIQKKLLVSCNRGAQIVLGMVRGYYDGYDREIHEVYQYDMERNIRPADYSRAEQWVSRPDKAAAQAAKADVFMVLPTVNMNRRDADNEDVTSLKDALRFVKTFNMEKGILGDNTAVYAPYYRQATFGTYALQDEAEKEKHLAIAMDDVREAFRWYLENCHAEGKPIVLFGYSQGAQLVKKLLAEFGQDERLSGSLAAAYVIGESVTQADLDASPWLKMAQGETDTGVIVSYDCVGKDAAERIAAEEAVAAGATPAAGTPSAEAGQPGAGRAAGTPAAEAGAAAPAAGQAGQEQPAPATGQPAAGTAAPAAEAGQPAAGQARHIQPAAEEVAEQSPSKALSINPLNWKTDSTEASKEMNRGYVVTDTYGNVKEEIPAFCGAYIDEKTGILVATGIDDPEKYAVKGLGVLPDGSFHLYDLTFFYNNLKENVAKRIAAFLGEEVEMTVVPEEPAENTGTGEPAENPGTADGAKPLENTETTDQEDAGASGTEEASVNTIVRR